MSDLVPIWEYPSQEFSIGDRVSFLYDCERLEGEVVRVYNTRENYHVEVDGVRYSVNRDGDRMKLLR